MSKYEHHFSHDEHHCVQLVPLFALLSESELAQVEQVVHHKTFEKGEAVSALLRCLNSQLWRTVL